MAHTEQPASTRRAFTQGVGSVFQGVGGTMFVVLMSVCCLSSVFGKDAERPDWNEMGWTVYPLAKALSVELMGGVGLFLGVAAVGLGLQATRRSSVVGGLVVTVVGMAFWAFHIVYAASAVRSVGMLLATAAMFLIFVGLFVLAIGAWREVRRDPPERDHEVLPKGYKIPYSWYHDDPPEVRLAKELEQRRRKLEVQQKELDLLEEKVRKSKEE